MANAEPWTSVPDPDMEALFKQFLGSFSNSAERENETFGTESTEREKSVEPILYSLRDHDQKSLYLHEETLVAAPLQGSNAAHEEVLCVLPNQFLEPTKFPLILGVKGGSQGLSCGTSDKPKLQLEDFDVKDLFRNDAEAKRFTFFKDFNGSTHTFESAAYPKWFLCSSVEAHQPLAVTDSPGGTAITTFYFQRK